MDLLLRRAQARPVPALGVGEGVHVARHVAGRAGIAVVEPGPAEVRRLLQDRHVGDAVPAQLDRRTRPRRSPRRRSAPRMVRLCVGSVALAVTDTRLPSWICRAASANLMPSTRPALGGLGSAQRRRQPSRGGREHARGRCSGPRRTPGTRPPEPASRRRRAASRANSTEITGSRLPWAMNTGRPRRPARSGSHPATVGMKPDKREDPRRHGPRAVQPQRVAHHCAHREPAQHRLCGRQPRARPQLVVRTPRAPRARPSKVSGSG